MAVKKSITHRKDIPHEPGQWMEFAELGWGALDELRTAKTREAMADFAALSPSIIERAQQEEDRKQEEAKAKGETYKSPEPTEYVSEFQKAGLLHKTIIAWSYPDDVTYENIDMLDEETAGWAYKMATEIHVPNIEDMGNSTTVLSNSSPVSEVVPSPVS